MNNLPSVLVVKGELLADVTLTAEQMAKLNAARATFRELQSILLSQLVPSLEGGWSNPIATEIESRLESITFDTQNFLWPHRFAGASHGAIYARAAK
ncbi:hypothetical protein [Pseudomonas sp. PS01303]|uniref:hypothetical protein n=1 Tax=Pseudomonas sp. PS01303 TaxID=2991439 RepID=UPI00249BDC52|nr:hypothetical protein [Pseudomonas sp. PS01303]